jgi:hypothetical protein
MTTSTAVQKLTNVCTYLDSTEKVFVSAALTAPISRMPQDDLFRGILQIVNRSYLELGQMPAGTTNEERDKTLKALSNLIIIDIKEFFPRLTLDEFNLSVRRGLRFEYGKYFGFNVLTVHKFIESYLACEERENALMKQQRFMQALQEKQEPETLTIEQKWEIMKSGILRQFETYQSTKVLRDFGNASYDFLDKAGFINLTNDEKKKIYQEAENKLQSEAIADTGSDLFMAAVRNKFKGEAHKAAVISKAKQLALAKFYDSNPDVPGILNSKQTFNIFCNE